MAWRMAHDIGIRRSSGHVGPHRCWSLLSASS
jgi:hypothetical protein